MSAPRAFVSYSWTTPEHQAWVLSLATQLRENGVDVILDKWELREGHDKYEFMESMVTDPTVTKVLMVCDKQYAEKADGRHGGVGTETQIISAELYSKTTQNKFLALATEVDEHGDAYLPTYLKSRIYTDVSTSELYDANFESVLRWLYDQPVHVKPTLGKPPSFLSAPSPVTLATSAAARRAITQIEAGTMAAEGAFSSYLDTLAGSFENLRLSQPKEIDARQKLLLDQLEAFLPYRNEFIDVTLKAVRTRSSVYTESLHAFFEQIIPFMFRPRSVSTWHRGDFDNFVFIVHELFLYTVAVFIKLGSFDELDRLLTREFFVRAEEQESMRPFGVIRQHADEFDRISRAKQKQSYRATLLKERAGLASLPFVEIMQADFVLFLRSSADRWKKQRNHRWFPETLLYTFEERSFEIFLRSQSLEYFERIQGVLNCNNADDFKALIGEFRTEDEIWLPRWNYHTLPVAELSNVQKVATGR